MTFTTLVKTMIPAASFGKASTLTKNVILVTPIRIGAAMNIIRIYWASNGSISPSPRLKVAANRFPSMRPTSIRIILTAIIVDMVSVNSLLASCLLPAPLAAETNTSPPVPKSI